jgi:non-specific serine/threonine protein kinase
MDFLIPGLLGTEKDFSARYVKPIESLKNSEKTAELRKIVYPFILRRKKEEVEKDLPEKEEITLFLEMADDQRKFYNETREYYRDLISNQIEDHGLAKSSIAILQALLKLRQAAIFPFLVDKTLQHISSCKYDLLKDILPEIFSEGYKTIIFSQFIGSLTKIESYLSKEKYKYSYLDGSTKNRETQINNFQTNPAVKAFLVSLKAGGTGLNLTAASYVILFDPWWNPAVERQAVDRAHRIGQQKKVTAYRLIVKDTIEEKIMKMQEDKKKLAENLITEESSFIKSLKRDDVDFLFT